MAYHHQIHLLAALRMTNAQKIRQVKRTYMNWNLYILFLALIASSVSGSVVALILVAAIIYRWRYQLNEFKH